MTLHPDEQARELRLEILEQYKTALEMHIKEWPHLGDCEWNCTTVGPLHELIAKARLAEAEWWEHRRDSHHSIPGAIEQNAVESCAGLGCLMCERLASLRQAAGEETK